MVDHESISVVVVDQENLREYTETKRGVIAGMIGFGDQSKNPLEEKVPCIYSHHGFRDRDGVYQEGQQGPLQLFVINGCESVTFGTQKSIVYTESGEFLIGAIDIKEQTTDGDELVSIAQQAYEDIYQLMEDTGKGELLRVGNYVTDILGETTITAGREKVITNRYRAFCTGRSRSIDTVFGLKTEELPTATGIGNFFDEKGLKIFFIAINRKDVMHHKNPKQSNPSDYDVKRHGIIQLSGNISTPRFNRSSSLSDTPILFVGGTASILGQEVVHLGDVEKQTIQALEIVNYAVEEAEKDTCKDYAILPVYLKVFIKRKEDYELVRSLIQGDSNPLKNSIIDVIYTHADVCRDGWLVEISFETVYQ